MKCFTYENGAVEDGFCTKMIYSTTGNYPAVSFIGKSLLYLADRVINTISEDGIVNDVEYKKIASGKNLLIPETNVDVDKALILFRNTSRDSLIKGKGKISPCALQGHLTAFKRCPICGKGTIDRKQFPKVASKIPAVNAESGSQLKYIHPYIGEYIKYNTLSENEISGIGVILEQREGFKVFGDVVFNNAVLLSMNKDTSISVRINHTDEFIHITWDGKLLHYSKFTKDAAKEE